MFDRFNVLSHIQMIKRWAESREAKLSLDVNTFELAITVKSRRVILPPRFISKTKEGGHLYITTYKADCPFAGWLPYEIKPWPSLARDKLLFKAFCDAHGLRVPRTWKAGEMPDRDFIVKPRNGSWSEGITGPYHFETWHDQRHTLPDADYYCDEFIFGQPCKIWYWNEKPVAMRRAKLPFLVADGKRELAKISAEPRGSFDRSYKLEFGRTSDMLAWQGWNEQSIPPAGERIYLDFFGPKCFDPTSAIEQGVEQDMLSDLSTKNIGLLKRIGHTLLHGNPPDIRERTLFTVDAVMDKAENLWLLEANCNPMVHPFSYTAMLDSVFSRDLECCN